MAVPQKAIDGAARYVGMGLSREVATGIIAVLWAESALNPGSQGTQPSETPGVLNPSGAFGLASWNGPRQSALASYAQRYGRDAAAYETQLDFVLTEAANSYPEFWSARRTPNISYQQVIDVMVRTYERPAKPDDEIARAVRFANELYPLVPSQAPAPIPAPMPQAPSPTMPPIPPQLIGLLVQIAAPIAERVMMGLVKAIIEQVIASHPELNLPTQPPTPQAPQTPQSGLSDLVEDIVERLLKRLPQAGLIPPIPEKKDP